MVTCTVTSTVCQLSVVPQKSFSWGGEEKLDMRTLPPRQQPSRRFVVDATPRHLQCNVTRVLFTLIALQVLLTQVSHGDLHFFVLSNYARGTSQGTQPLYSGERECGRVCTPRRVSAQLEMWTGCHVSAARILGERWGSWDGNSDLSLLYR